MVKHPQIKLAYRLAADGAQVLFIRRSLDGEPATAWLVDYHLTRLIATAKQLGVRRIRVLRANREGQMIELGPTQLYKAAIACATPEMKFV